MNRILTPVVALVVVVVALTVGASANIGAAGATTSSTTITVCKKGDVTGSFPFSLNGGASFQVAVNQCVSKAVDAGGNLVTELVDPTGNTLLKSIVVSPSSAKFAKHVRNSKFQAGYAKVDVAAGKDVTVSFWNQPAGIGQLKVCKVAASPELLGQSFGFTEQTGGITVGQFSLIAEPAPGSCSTPTSYPVGTMVNIAEAPQSGSCPTIFVSDVSGATWTGGLDSAATVQRAGTTVVTYTNSEQAGPCAGYLEVCVQAGDSSLSPGPWDFTVKDSNGEVAGNVSTLTGQCSGDLALAPGVYTVTESISSPDTISAITGTPTAPLTYSLATASGVFAVAAASSETAVFTDDS